MSISVDNLKLELEKISNAVSESVVIGSVTSLNQLPKDDNKDWSIGTTACMNLADQLRTASLRTPLGEANIIESLSNLFQQANGQQVDFQLQALRVLGNLCFDNESNRKRVKDAGIIPIVATWLTTDHKDLIRTICGFYLNSSMDYAPIQIEIAECGAAAKLIQLVRYDEEDDGTITMAIKMLDGLAAEDTARKIIATAETVKAYINTIEDLYKSEEFMEELDNLENLSDTLLQVILDDDNLQNEIIDLGKLSFLLNFLEDTGKLLISDKEDKEKVEEIRKTVSKIAIYASSTDSKMESLYNDPEILSRFLSMAQSENEAVHQFAVYALGNLARTDKHCIELVENYNLGKILLDLYQATENATFQYAILGCLKHLSLPASNKIKIGNEDCIRILTPALDESKDMLKRNQFLTIGIVKLLCAANYENALRIITEGTLTSVTAFLKRVDDVAAKSEATRVLTNLIKTVWVQKNNLQVRHQVLEANVMEYIIELVRISTFPVLKNDGIMALTLIFSDPDCKPEVLKAVPWIIGDAPVVDIQEANEDAPTEQEKPESRSFLEVITDDIYSNKELPVQIKTNTIFMLLKAIETIKTVQGAIEKIEAVALNRLENMQTENNDLDKYVDTLVKVLKQR